MAPRRGQDRPRRVHSLSPIRPASEFEETNAAIESVPGPKLCEHIVEGGLRPGWTTAFGDSLRGASGAVRFASFERRGRRPSA